MEGKLSVLKFSATKNNNINFHSFYEIISSLFFMVENGVNPCSQIIPLLTRLTLHTEVNFFLYFGIDQKSNMYTPIYLLMKRFMLNVS